MSNFSNEEVVAGEMASLIVASKNISLTLLGIVFYSVVQVNASQLDPSLISRELRSFANDALGVDKLQVR